MSDNDDLPEPHDGMTAEEKGELLLRYIEAGTPVARMVKDDSGSTSWERLPFNDASMFGADFTGANLRGADLRRAMLCRCKFVDADLSFVDASEASFGGSNLSGAHASFANLSDADFSLVALLGTVLATYTGTPRDVKEAVVDVVTFKRSSWSPTRALEWAAGGAKLKDFPFVWPSTVVQSFHLRDGPSITLFFPRTLDFKSKTLVEALLSTFLAHEAPDCRSAYEPTDSGGALVRLSGLPVEQLVQVADRLADFFNRPARAEITKAIEGAVGPAVDRAIEKNLPEVISRAVAPMAVLQAQLGERIIKHIDSIYAEVEWTEIKLSDEVVEALRRLEMEVIETKLDRSGWAWDATAGKLVRAGGWAVGTGAAGSGLVEFLMWLARMGG